ncbi:MAG TPA: adenine phosphoribosyltransferase [Thermoleophilaceae bacterium]|nr:adenine phosphoribosyltransferase [Thermoleophilaceae bacterium]
MSADIVAALIRDIPDFPKPGIVFKDVTPVFADPEGLRAAVESVVGHATDARATHIVSAEARGFVLGGAAASAAGLGFVLGRKPGKLPRQTVAVEYELEYGTDVLEVHADAFPDGARVLVHDDLLATGGTAGALCELVERAGAEVAGCSFLIELAFLGGRGRLEGRGVESLVAFDSE